MHDWKAIAERNKNRLATLHQQAADTMNDVAVTALTLGGAGIAGYVHGRKGGMPTYAGIPLDLLVAGVGGVVGLAGWAGGYSSWVMGLANGFGAYYVGTLAAGKGQAARKEKKEFLGREYTADEQRTNSVQSRAPITAGASHEPGFVQRWAA